MDRWHFGRCTEKHLLEALDVIDELWDEVLALQMTAEGLVEGMRVQSSEIDGMKTQVGVCSVPFPHPHRIMTMDGEKSEQRRE